MEGVGDGCSEVRRRIRRLVKESLLPLASVTKPCPVLTKEVERDLLLSLTSVFRQVRQWRRQTGDLHFDQAESTVVGAGCSSSRDDGASGDGCDCLEDVVPLLVSFLMVESLYVQHLIENLLLEIFKFLVKSGDVWKNFLQLLWISFQASFYVISSISNNGRCENGLSRCSMPSSSSMDNALITKRIACSIVNFFALFHVGPVKDIYSMKISLLKALRDILKFVKRKHSGLFKGCMELVVASLSTYPWSLPKCSEKSEIVCWEVYCRLVESSHLAEKGRYANSDCMLLGMLLQLLCSIVDPNNMEGEIMINEFSVYSRLMNLVHDLLSCYLCKVKEYNKIGILQYLRHKALMLMIRLSMGNQWKCSYAMLWMELLKEYFEDLLYKPLKKCHTETNSALEDSPFLAGFIDEEKPDNLCSSHLQRQAIFLFLKCCFTSSHSSSKPGSADQTESCNVCSRELSNWLTKHISVDMLVDCENYYPSCSKFSVSLLELFVNEDDLLFELLLLVMDAAYFNLQEETSENESLFIQMATDIVPQLSIIFHPIHLFHLFLYLLHYDHMILLDYLISKDTGIQCLQYLMRCMHSVCRSWPVFLNFSLHKFDSGQQDCQERNIFLIGKDTAEYSSFFQSNMGSSLKIEKDNQQENIVRKRQKTGLWAFENAKNCLISLGISIEDLSKKNLFPYNPAALLKSFNRFQELCHGVK